MSGQSKPIPRGAALDLLGALQSGEGEGDAGERALVRMRFALGGLERFPAGAGLGVAEDVRVAADHLGADRRHDVIEREGAALLGHAGMVDDLELEIAELVLQRLHVVAPDRVGDLIGFLDRVGRDRLERLGRVPFAAGLADRAAGP